MRKMRMRAVAAGVMLVGCIALGAWAGYSGFAATHVPLLRSAREALGPTASFAPDYGPSDQLMFLYFASSTCSWCTRPETPGIIRTALEDVSAAAAANDLGFVSVGVALDWIPARGVEYLQGVAEFQQISAGYRWANIAAVDLPGLPPIASTPQVVVVRRQLVTGGDNEGGGVFSSSGHEVLVHKIGLFDISSWADNGSPLPVAGLAQQSGR